MRYFVLFMYYGADKKSLKDFAQSYFSLIQDLKSHSGMDFFHRAIAPDNLFISMRTHHLLFLSQIDPIMSKSSSAPKTWSLFYSTSTVHRYTMKKFSSTCRLNNLGIVMLDSFKFNRLNLSSIQIDTTSDGHDREQHFFDVNISKYFDVPDFK